jgi:hypothetical protein
MRPQALLTLLGIVGLAVAAGAQGRRQEVRSTDPPWILAGKTTTVRLFGQDLKTGQITFSDPSVQAKVLKAEPYTGASDAEKRRGNTAVEAEITAPQGLRPGAYRFKLVQEGGAEAEGKLSIDLDAPEVQETEPNNSLSKPQALPGGSVTVLGKLDNEGADVFRIEGKAGETWRFEAWARRLKPGNTLEPVLRLRDPRMAPVRTAVDQGDDCFIEYRLPVDGPYVVELFDGENKTGGELVYRLAIRKL